MKKVPSFGFLMAVVLLAATASSPVFAGGHGGAGQNEKVPMFIGFTNQPSQVEEALVRQAGGDIKYTYTLVPAIAASVPPEAIEGLQRNPRVTYIEPDIEVHIIDHGAITGNPELDNTWGVKHIGAGAVHNSGNRGSGVKVAILDTGVAAHSDLSPDPNCSKGFGYPSYQDGNRHGTHVFGTVAALKNGTGVVGVAPEATICALKVFSDSGSGSFSDVVAA